MKHFETPYVVKLHRFTALSETQEVFTFSHPNFSGVIDNSRSCSLTFERHNAPAAVCHGFAGYFDAELYKKVTALAICMCSSSLSEIIMDYAAYRGD